MSARKDYTEGMEFEEFMQKMDTVPAFMDRTPDGELPPLLEALQSLKYDEENADVCAENYKKDGNENFKLKKFKWAVECYDKALKLPITKDDLKANLFFNRAAANFQLGNFRKVIADCTEAVKFDPNYLKAYLKGAQALFVLEKYSEAKVWIDRGLSIDDDNTVLLELRTKTVQAEKKRSFSERLAKKEQASLTRLLTAISNRKIIVAPPNPVDSQKLPVEVDPVPFETYSEFIAKTPSGASVSLTAEGKLIWPLRLLFPEMNQQEFIDQVEEDVTFEDMLKLVIDENPPPWDTDHVYKDSRECRCFFSDVGQKRVFEIPAKMTVKSLLAQKEYLVENLLPAMFVLSLRSKFSETFLSRFSHVIKLK